MKVDSISITSVIPSGNDVFVRFEVSYVDASDPENPFTMGAGCHIPDGANMKISEISAAAATKVALLGESISEIAQQDILRMMEQAA